MKHASRKGSEEEKASLTLAEEGRAPPKRAPTVLDQLGQQPHGAPELQVQVSSPRLLTINTPARAVAAVNTPQGSATGKHLARAKTFSVLRGVKTMMHTGYTSKEQSAPSASELRGELPEPVMLPEPKIAAKEAMPDDEMKEEREEGNRGSWFNLFDRETAQPKLPSDSETDENAAHEDDDRGQANQGYVVNLAKRPESSSKAQGTSQKAEAEKKQSSAEAPQDEETSDRGFWSSLFRRPESRPKVQAASQASDGAKSGLKEIGESELSAPSPDTETSPKIVQPPRARPKPLVVPGALMSEMEDEQPVLDDVDGTSHPRQVVRALRAGEALGALLTPNSVDSPQRQYFSSQDDDEDGEDTAISPSMYSLSSSPQRQARNPAIARMAAMRKKKHSPNKFITRTDYIQAEQVEAHQTIAEYLASEDALKVSIGALRKKKKSQKTETAQKAETAQKTETMSMPDSILAGDVEPQPTIAEDIESEDASPGQKVVSRWGAAKSYVGEFSSFGKDEVVSALTFLSSGSKTFAFDRAQALDISRTPTDQNLLAPAEAVAAAPAAASADEPAADATASDNPWSPLKLPQVRIPPSSHRSPPMLAPIGPPAAEEKKDEKTKSTPAPVAPSVAATPSIAAAPTPTPPPPASGPPPFIPRPGETPAEALRRRLREQKMAVTIAPTSMNSIYNKGADDDDSLDPILGGKIEDEDVEVDDPFKPNIFFQNARYSGFAPAPKSLPEHQQLPPTIYFYLRSTDFNPIPVHKKLPDKVVELIVEAKTIKGHEAAGPIARIDFNNANVLGLGVRKDALEMGVSQLVIDVPSHEAYPKQDPRIEPSSFTFQPYQISSLHGDWLPRVNVPIKVGKPPSTPPSGLKWRCVGEEAPSKGTGLELSNDSLARALLRKTEFTQSQWNAFGIHYLTEKHYIRVRDDSGEETYFQPEQISPFKRKVAPKFTQDLEDLEKTGVDEDPPSPEHIGNPYAPAESTRSSTGGSHRSSRASLASERRLRESMKRMSKIKLEGLPSHREEPAGPAEAPAADVADASATKATAASNSGAGKRADGGRGNLCGASPASPQPGGRWGRTTQNVQQESANCAVAASDTKATDESKTAADPKTPENKSSLLTKENLRARRGADDLMGANTPGWMSSRSIRSTTSGGVAGGPPDRDLWPRDFAADSAREADLEVARAAARKELAKKREKEREAERLRRATRVGSRRGSGF